MNKGESIIFKNEEIEISTLESVELVLFYTEEHAEYYAGEMLSGNQY